jgi:HSP20 family protein
VTLMRFDPFRELDRLAEQTFSAGARALRSMPMEALRRGDMFIVHLDLPGVRRDEIDLTVERNVVNVRARRTPDRQDGDEVLIDERPYGEFARQLFLGDNLDSERMTADTQDGVLTITIPVSEKSKPRRIPLGSADAATGGTDGGAEATAGTAGGTATGTAGGTATGTAGGTATGTGAEPVAGSPAEATTGVASSNAPARDRSSGV